MSDHVLHCERAWIDEVPAGPRMARDVELVVAGATIERIAEDVACDRSCTATHLDGVVLPGLVNAHSHAFHRLLRGRVQRPPADGAGSFWSWRAHMYDLVGLLDVDLWQELATAAFGEMLLAGITTVGEFHYLHGAADDGDFGRALAAAADEAGIRMTMLDACYLTGHVGATEADPALDGVQQRFSDGTAAEWVRRTASHRDTPLLRHGAAIHSVRAVPPDAMAEVAAAAARRGWVVHAHVAEQRSEVEDCRRELGRGPVEVLADAGALGPAFTAVHAVWLDDVDTRRLASTGAMVCACPTTERDLADGVVHAAALADAGVEVALGSDQHAVVDLFEEARALELDQRLVTNRRCLHDPGTLLAMATRTGARSLGWPEAGRLAVGSLADLCVVDVAASTRLAGTPDDHLVDAIVFAATAADVTDTMVGGQWRVRDRRHHVLDVAGMLARVAAEVDARRTGRQER